jgi:AcrR family transcriptional regulator
MTAAAKRRAPSRSTELTRRALIDAAVAVFAEHGYDSGSVRLITRKAKANQAAITYHFGGKEGLYREVLRAGVAAFEERSLLDADSVERLPREDALRLLLRQLLVPLLRRDRLGRHVRILAWESVRPTPIFREFITGEPLPTFAAAQRLVARFLPADATPQLAALTMFWLVQQPIAFVRNIENLAAPPYNLTFDDAAVAGLVDLLVGLSLQGLHGLGSAPAGGPAPVGCGTPAGRR